MSCNHTDPCKDPCNTDPCYDNCGCLNPTTFECVTKPGNHHDIKVSNDMNGKQVLSALNNRIAELNDLSGKVAIDHDDLCPNNLVDKIEAGANVSISQVGTGCDKKLVITAGSGIGPAGADVNVKVTSSDTTSGFLYNKINVGAYLQKAIQGGGGNQKLIIDLASLSNFISTDAGNALVLGADSKLKTLYSIPDGSETKIQGAGAVTVTGIGTNSDPYIIYSNASVTPKRAKFDGVWKTLTMTPPAGVSVISNKASYRFRFDGTIEFKGRIQFGVTYSSLATITASSLFTFPVGPNEAILNASEIIDPSFIKSVSTYSAPSFDIYDIFVQSGKLGVRFTYTGALPLTSPRVFNVDFDSAVYHLNIP